MNAKTLFQKDKELCDRWAAICHQDWFERVMVYAMNQLTEETVVSDQITGAKRLKDILLALTEEESSSIEEPKSGFQHDVLAEARRLKEK